MAVIYKNIPAVLAGPVSLIGGGRDTVIALRANYWGTTKVYFQTYCDNDLFPIKLWNTPNSPVNANNDLSTGFIGRGLILYFTVQDPDPLTTQLLVNVYQPDCCLLPKDEEIKVVHSHVAGIA